MYQLISPQTIINNVVALSSPYLQPHQEVNGKTLKQAYRAFLTHLQPHCYLPTDHQLFYADPQTEEALKDYFLIDELSDDIKNKTDINHVMYANPLERKQVLQNAFANIKKNDPNFADIFKLVINTVFCVTTPRIGGTSVNPKYIGVICAYYDMEADESVVPELLIHEFTHNALFLDELRYQHYTSYADLQNPAAKLDAVDRGAHYQFPFNRVLHSLIVSAEILQARNAYLGHAIKRNQHLPTDQILARSRGYLKQVRENDAIQNLVMPRARELLAACEHFYADFTVNH